MGAIVLAILLLFPLLRGAEPTTALAPDRRAPPVLIGVDHADQEVSRHALAGGENSADAMEEPSFAPPVQAASGSPVRRIHGTIVVSDERGIEHRVTSGVGTFGLYGEPEGG